MPRHFSKQTFKNQAEQEHIDNHNAFTRFAHLLGLGRFFKYASNTPLQKWRDEMRDPHTPNHHNKK